MTLYPEAAVGVIPDLIARTDARDPPFVQIPVWVATPARVADQKQVVPVNANKGVCMICVAT
ncbi:MAG: hypothetical protein O7H40_16305 [Gammaproteobacteria bacterium]|nr:hypothetical protein [Gammaproteobacteria bacterium]